MDVARIVRFFDPSPSDDLVQKRASAIAELKNSFGRMNAADGMLRTVEAVTGVLRGEPALPHAVAVQIENAIKKESPAFLAEERPFESGVCGLAALLQVMESVPKKNETSNADRLAIAVWLSVEGMPTCHEPKVEQLRQLVLGVAQARLERRATAARTRLFVPNFGDVGSAPVDQATFTAATSGTVQALKRNADLDREELDILWWALSERCELLSVAFAALPDSVRAVAAAVDMARIVRRIPAPAHLSIASRGFNGQAVATLSDVVEAFSPYREKLIAEFGAADIVGSHPKVFWALASLTGAMSEFGQGASRELSYWSGRVFFECYFAELLTEEEAV
jgi:hypothetical protein